MYEFREAIARDVNPIQAIDRLFAATSHSAEVLRTAIAEGKVVVAASGGGLAGYVRWDYFWGSIPLCLMLRVKPDHQRRGIGRRLFEHIEANFRERSCTFLLSSTEATNEGSQRFHEACGFRQIGTLTELGQDVPEIFYRRDIQ
jgi:GNAT superfamily N-acetyltransferase